MTKSAMIRARVEPTLKAEVESIFEQLGLNATEAITLFYKQVQIQQRIPFEIALQPPEPTGYQYGIRERPMIPLEDLLDGLGPLDEEELAAFGEVQAERRLAWRDYDFFDAE